MENGQINRWFQYKHEQYIWKYIRESGKMGNNLFPNIFVGTNGSRTYLVS